MRIGLIRHGETEWNARGLLQGTSDIPLNERGLDQARDAANLLIGQGWQRIYASPLQRAMRTAEIIAHAVGLEAPTPVPGVIERSFGDLEGERYWTPEGGRRRLDEPSIEPVEVVRARTREALAAIERAHPDKDTLVVAHGTVIRLLLDDLLDLEAPHIGNLALSILERRGGRVVVTLANGYPLRVDEP